MQESLSLVEVIGAKEIEIISLRVRIQQLEEENKELKKRAEEEKNDDLGS